MFSTEAVRGQRATHLTRCLKRSSLLTLLVFVVVGLAGTLPASLEIPEQARVTLMELDLIDHGGLTLQLSSREVPLLRS
jgi:hypothetical protein